MTVPVPTYRVHGGLHHNGQFYKHGSTVPASLFGSNDFVDDELGDLIAAGTLKTEAEFLPPAALQSTLDEKDAEILRLREELAKHEESASGSKPEQTKAEAKAEAKAAEMEKARLEGPEAAADEQFPKSTL